MEKYHVLIGCNGMDNGSVSLSAEISALLRSDGMTPCSVSESLCSTIGTDHVCSIEDCTHVVTVGGDGTIIKWGKEAARYGIPLLGVNKGRLGFMATVEPSDIQRIPSLLSAPPTISRRMLMDCELVRKDGSILSKKVLNDVVISRDSTSKLPEFAVRCNEHEVSRLRADGVIFSTPTGSTAYSLSAGGPIIAPDMECIEFTALCPHTLFNRPMLFSASQVVSVCCTNYQSSRVTVSIDGESGIAFGDGDILRLSRSELTLSLIESGEGFFGAVRNKLMTPLK